jgi:two-component system, chemotaxis family, chemotaxis protein CheY
MGWSLYGPRRRRERQGTPVVVITTEGSEAHVVQVLSLGARGYIRKPFTPDQVREHVIPLVAVKA